MAYVAQKIDGTGAAILWMVAAMAGFAGEDVLVKLASQTLPTGQILAILGLCGGCIFCVWATARGHRIIDRDLWSRPILLRNLGEVIGTICFVTALGLTDLSSVSAILQATPLGVTLGAALFLGAKVGWRRWSAIAIGFAGVLLILRPGLDAFEPASLFAVASVIGYSIRDLATRAAPARIASQSMAAQSFILVMISGLVMLPFGPEPAPLLADEIVFLGAATVLGVLSYYAIITATRLGDITVVTPFRYSRLLFAMVFGIILFGERPDAATWAGAAIIIGSGLYTLARERKRANGDLS